MSERPNVVYFAADQMRADTLHHLGNPTSHTPNLDALAKEGVSFRNAFCQNPVCVPSRCSFLTGLYPHTTGHRTMHFLQDPQEPNILRTMKENGYEVIWCGRNDVVPADRSKEAYCDEYFAGFDLEAMKKAQAERQAKLTPEEREKEKKRQAEAAGQDGFYSFYTGDVTDKQDMGDMDDKIVAYAMDYLERRRQAGTEKPFFLYVTLGYPHPPYGCKRPFYGMTERHALPPRRPDLRETSGKPSMLWGIHGKQGLEGWSEERWNELRATYLDMTAKFDDLFGWFREKLRETGFDENTNIFVFSDHGDYTGDYGIAEKVQNCFDDPVCNVPLIIRPAKNTPCIPRVTEALAELVDLTATVAELTEVNLGYTQFGRSLAPVLAGADEHREEVHCEGGRIHGEEQCMELGHGPESAYWPRLSTQASEGPEHTKAVMLRGHDFKYVKRLYEDDELYDLKKDPMELHNCIHQPEYEGIVRQFKEKALDFLLETGDFVPNRKDKR